MMLEIALTFLNFWVLIFTCCRYVLPSLSKNCCADCKLSSLITNYLMYSSDLTVKSLSEPQIQLKLKATSFWVLLIDDFLCQGSV